MDHDFKTTIRGTDIDFVVEITDGKFSLDISRPARILGREYDEEINLKACLDPEAARRLAKVILFALGDAKNV